MIGELKKSMDKVITSTGVDSQRQFRAKYFSRSLVIIYTLQTTLDFEKEENLAAKLFQLYEFCRQQLIKCFREQVVEGRRALAPNASGGLVLSALPHHRPNRRRYRTQRVNSW